MKKQIPGVVFNGKSRVPSRAKRATRRPRPALDPLRFAAFHVTSDEWIAAEAAIAKQQGAEK